MINNCCLHPGLRELEGFFFGPGSTPQCPAWPFLDELCSLQSPSAFLLSLHNIHVWVDITPPFLLLIVKYIQQNLLSCLPLKPFKSIQFISIYYIHVQSPPLSSSGTFLLLQKKAPYSLSSHSSFPPSLSPWQLLNCSLSLWICLLWTFHIMESYKMGAFCVWLLPFSMVFAGFML